MPQAVRRLSMAPGHGHACCCPGQCFDRHDKAGMVRSRQASNIAREPLPRGAGWLRTRAAAWGATLASRRGLTAALEGFETYRCKSIIHLERHDATTQMSGLVSALALGMFNRHLHEHFHSMPSAKTRAHTTPPHHYSPARCPCEFAARSVIQA